MSNTAYPCKFYCPSLYTKHDYVPSSGFRKYYRVRAMSGTRFEYSDAMSLAKNRPGEMSMIDASPTQLKYETKTANERIRQRSTSRSRATISSDRGSVFSNRRSVCSGDSHTLSENKDLKLARSRLNSINTSDVEEYPPVRSQSNQYEILTHNLINYGAMRRNIM